MHCIAEEDHRAITEALVTTVRLEVSGLRALCIVYRALLEAAGIDAPEDSESAEALRRYRALYERFGLVDQEQHNELISKWWGE